MKIMPKSLCKCPDTEIPADSSTGAGKTDGGSYEVKEFISVALFRNGENVDTANKTQILVPGDITFAEFKPMACRALGFQPYPIRLTIPDARTPPKAGATMSSIYHAVAALSPDDMLYIAYG